MQSPVFECPICFNRYNATSHKPLTLPCGHVYCFECLERMISHGNKFCPADSIQYNVPITQLSCCHAILNYLPSEVGGNVGIRFLHCKRHPGKKIKFVCEEHGEYLCTHCVLEHAGAVHIIKSYEVDYKAEREKPIRLQVKLQALILILTRAREKIERKLKSLEEYHEKQQSKLAHEYNKTFKLAAEKQIELLKALSKNSQATSNAIKEAITTNNKSLSKLNVIVEKLNTSLNSLTSINDFDEFIDSASNFLNTMYLSATKETLKRIALRLISIADKSELRAISHRTHTKRAHSTTRECKRHSKRQRNIVHRLEAQQAHRHGTLSPVREKRVEAAKGEAACWVE
eukprot:TRINITY_DN16143_c0_g1_i1.p1 TRINITY_DN16143_c0_g1~~TRINITY_DN16143_c0_g1_i1.p1  ORF type:complete len:382 (-),score=57.97 TRINITY_DN16143_c0_g1_i1:97-1128(-)